MQIHAHQPENGQDTSCYYQCLPFPSNGHIDSSVACLLARELFSSTTIPSADARPGRISDGRNRQCLSESPEHPKPTTLPLQSQTMSREETANISTNEESLAPIDQSLYPLAIQIELSATFLRLFREVPDLHDEILGLRIILDNVRTDYGRQQENTSLIESQFMEASSTFMAATAGPDSASEKHRSLQEIWEQLQRSKENLKRAEERVRTKEKEIQKKYGRLFSKETELYDEIRQRREDIRSSIGSEVESESDSVPLSAHSGTSTDEDPRVQEYYEQLGDNKLHRERLFNFEATYQQKVRFREGQKELGVTPELSDADFYKAELRERLALTRDIVKTSREAQHLKRECEEAGIVVEDPITPLLAENEALDHLLRAPRRTLQYPAPPNSAPGLLNPDIVLLFGDIDNKARVSRWLSEIQQAKADRNDSFHTIGPETTHTRSLNPEMRAIPHGFTEQEAEGLLPLPDYGLLKTSNIPTNALEIERRHQFLPDPPRRRYSEPMSQIRRVDVNRISCIELNSSRSVQ
jgi:hypothetical protein